MEEDYVYFLVQSVATMTVKIITTRGIVKCFPHIKREILWSGEKKHLSKINLERCFLN